VSTSENGSAGPIPEDDGENVQPTRLCGRCRHSFPFDDSTEPGPKWWLCPPCHEALLGKATLANRAN
jgi:hypothetical protein